MNNKKNPARFNIKFDLDNPKHKKAIAVLNQKKRCIAEFIADAINAYEQNTVDIEETVTRLVKKMMKTQQNNLSPSNSIEKASDDLPDFDFDEIADDLANFKNE